MRSVRVATLFLSLLAYRDGCEASAQVRCDESEVVFPGRVYAATVNGFRVTPRDTADSTWITLGDRQELRIRLEAGYPSRLTLSTSQPLRLTGLTLTSKELSVIPVDPILRPESGWSGLRFPVIIEENTVICFFASPTARYETLFPLPGSTVKVSMVLSQLEESAKGGPIRVTLDAVFGEDGFGEVLVGCFESGWAGKEPLEVSKEASWIKLGAGCAPEVRVSELAWETLRIQVRSPAGLQIDDLVMSEAPGREVIKLGSIVPGPGSWVDDSFPVWISGHATLYFRYSRLHGISPQFDKQPVDFGLRIRMGYRCGPSEQLEEAALTMRMKLSRPLKPYDD